MTPASSGFQQPGAGNGTGSGFAALSIVAAFHEKPVDPASLAHRFGMGETQDEPSTVLRAARHVGLKARLVRPKPSRLPHLPLPALLAKRGGGWLVLAKLNGDQALILDPAVGRPQTLTVDALAELWSGDAILCTSRATLAGAARAFDLTWFIPSLVKYRHAFGEVLLISFFIRIFELISPIFFQVIVDKVLVHQSLTTLDVLVLALVVTTIFEILLTGIRSYLFSHTSIRVDVELGARLFQHTLSLPLAYFQARRVGDTVARARELETIRSFLTGNALTVVLDIFFGLLFFAVMYVYSPMLTAIVALTVPFYAAISFLITPVLRRRLDEKFNRGAESQAFLVESVSAVETLKAMAVEPRMQERWEQLLAGYVGASFKAGNLANLGGQAVQLVNRLGMAAVLWFGARMVMQNELTVGELIAFNMLAGRVAAPILRLAQLWQDFQQFRISVNRLGDILNAVPEPAGRPGQASPPPIRGAIRLEHVGFRYRPDIARAIDELSLDVPAGQVIGIVGPSGSGKSTLTKLVQRLYVPEAGRVLVDGVDLALVDPAWLRRQVGVVLQENVLLNRSIRDNIALAMPAAPMEAVIRAAQLAGAHEFVLALPHGYDTEIGERGATLSGGQRQRIAIARALLTEPPILIFDEATSALDYESEKAIRDNMRAIAAGRTVLIIAHRLAAVRDAHRIITIEGGRLTEDGTHEELLRRGGRYATLWRHQLGQQPENAA